MIDINKIKKDLINYGALKVYEYDIDLVQEEEEEPVVLNNTQLVDIMANRYDVVKVNINLISRTEGEPDSVAIVKSVFVRTLYVDQDNTKMLIYTQSPDDDGTMSQIIISCTNGTYSYQMVDTDIGGGGGGTGTEVSGTNDGTNWTSLTIDGDTYGIPKGGSGGNVSDLYLEITGEEPTQSQLEQVYTQKPDVLRVGMGGNENVIVAYKSMQSDDETRLYYFNVQTSDGVVQVIKIEYSEEDGYIMENYEWSLDRIVHGTNDGTNWTSLTINGDTYSIPQGGGTGTDKYLSNAELTTSEVPSTTEKDVLFSALDTANANFALLPSNRSFWTTYDDYMKAIEGTKLEELTLVAGTAGNVRIYGYDTAISYNQTTNNLALAAQTADNAGYLLMTINVEAGTHTYLLDGTDNRVTIAKQSAIDSCPPCLGFSRTGDTGLLKYNNANITGEPYRHWTHAGLSGSTIEHPDPTNALPILFKVSTTTSETKTELVLTMNDGVEHKVVMNEVDIGSTIESVYKGKTLSILGDSISTFAGAIPTGNATYYPRGDVSDVSNTWWKKLADALGMTILVNNSWSGSWVTTANGEANAGCMTRCQSLHSGNINPDVIIVWMGINDFNNEAALGTYDGKSAVPSDTTKFREAYAIMLNKILTRYKTSEVWVCTLPQMERNADVGFPEINENGVSLKDFNDAIVELADAFGVKILDHNKAGMTYQNMDTYTVDWDSSTSKGLHPNDAGHSLIANNDIRQMDNAVRKRY